jgi:uncharacterized membrane protein
MFAWAHYVLLLLGLLASALIGGFFYAYSVSVMPGLSAASPLVAIEAMRSINAVIRTAVFAFSFFGALVFPLAAAGLASNRPVMVLALTAVVVYGLGAFAVSLGINVPLNDALAAATPTPESAAQVWQDYAGRWTLWNHVRAVASIVAFGLLAAAVVIEHQR